MARARRIGILTGGGDVPGLNSVIKSVVYRGDRARPRGLRHPSRLGGADPPATGREARPDVRGAARSRLDTRAIDRTGGTVLHTSRTNPRKMRADRLPAHLSAERAATMTSDGEIYDLTPVVLENIERLGLDYLVPIGGDDTLSFAQTLHDHGVPLIAIPKTMDNDVQGTEYCIGFSTAITRAKEAINRQRTTLGSHERIGVFRVFGRDCGFTALYTAYVTSARCLIPEVPFDLDELSPSCSSRTATTTPAATPSSSPRRAPSGPAARSRSWARRMPSAIAARPTSPRSWQPRSRTGPAWRPSSPT